VTTVPLDPTVRFGIFELDRRNGELRKAGVRLNLQPQPFEVLSMLVARPGELVTREELRQQLWPDDTFVDFQHGLSAAVNRLRDTLGDSAETPRFIETVPRRGYRFIGNVERPPAPEPAAPLRRSTMPARLLLVAIVPVVAAAAVAWWVWPRAGGTESLRVEVVPLTSDKGDEESPSFAPDGNAVAYAASGETGDNSDIYVRWIDAPRPIRLTTDPARDVRPAFSPDGRAIGFVRVTKDVWTYVVMPAVGGSERTVAALPQDFGNPITPFGPCWSSAWLPDGKSIVLDGLRVLSLETGQLRSVTGRNGAHLRGWFPAIAPDGRTLAFAAPSSQATASIYVMDLAGDGQPQGEPRTVTTIDGDIWGIAWTADSRALVFAGGRLSGRSGLSKTIRRVAAVPGATPVQVALGEDVTAPAIAARAARLAFVRHTDDVDIWRATIPVAGAPMPAAERFLSSSRSDWNPQYSPDGSRIAFESMRTGDSAIWVAERDGSNPQEIFSRPGRHAGTPRWSPDGRQIAFDSSAAGNFDVYVIQLGAAQPRRLTTDAADDAIPSWSPDGKWIYFASNRTGRNEVWKVPSAGGMAEQVTRNGGACVFPSSDGTQIYYTKHDRDSALWTMPVAGGEERQVLPSVVYRDFLVFPDGIYFGADTGPGGQYGVFFLDFATHAAKLVVPLGERPNLGLAVSPDRHQLLYVSGSRGSDVMLVNGFQ
jgi:Tol biopolymer transport system component/DNA-binding winged helix-turn-helix (wHTH) protein